MKDDNCNWEKLFDEIDRKALGEEQYKKKKETEREAYQRACHRKFSEVESSINAVDHLQSQLNPDYCEVAKEYGQDAADRQLESTEKLRNYYDAERRGYEKRKRELLVKLDEILK